MSDLLTAKQVKSEELVNNINGGLVDLKNSVFKKEIPENENANKIIDFNKQQKGRNNKKTQNINSQTNASKITSSTCTSKNR